MKKIKLIAITGLSCLCIHSNVRSVNITADHQNKYNNFLLVKVKTLLTSGDIIKYLNGEGLVVDSTPVLSGTTWTCNTHKGSIHYVTYTYTDGTNIISHEDIRL